MTNNQMEIIYIKYYKEVYLYAFFLCKNYHLAQDLTSDTFFKSYMTIGNSKHIKYWLFKVCKNMYLDYLKKPKVYGSDNSLENTLSTTKTPLDHLIDSEKNKNLYNLINQLQDSYKEILILYYFCGFSIKDISQLKKRTENATKTMLFRARNRLKQEMEAHNEL